MIRRIHVAMSVLWSPFSLERAWAYTYSIALYIWRSFNAVRILSARRARGQRKTWLLEDWNVNRTLAVRSVTK